MLNLNKLNKALNGSKQVRWYKDGKTNYIMSNFFVLKTDQPIKGGALIKLVSIFGTVPNEGEGLKNVEKNTTKMEDFEIRTVKEYFKKGNGYGELYSTNLLLEFQDAVSQIYRKDEEYIFINQRYVDLVNQKEKNIEMIGKNGNSPVYFIQGIEEIMLLPLRVPEVPKFLK